MLRQPEEHLHGRLRFYHEGVGQCDLSSGASVGCNFCCFRYVSGHTDIFCYHNHQDIGPHPVRGDGTFDGGNLVDFFGEVTRWAEDGGPLQVVSSDQTLVLHAPQAMVINRSFRMQVSRQSTGAELCTTLNAVEWSVGPQKFDFSYLRFSLVNCLFQPLETAPVILGDFAIEGSETPLPQIPAAPQLPLQVGDFQVFLRPVPNYREVAEAVWHRGGVEITAHAIIVIHPDGPTQGLEFHNRIEEMCVLLSLAKGTAIHYIEVDCLGAQGDVVNRFLFHNPRLMRFSGRDLTALRDATQLKRFIEEAHPHLASADANWNVRRAIDLLTDAKAEGDLLELRGLKLVNCLELLRQRYLTRTEQEFIFPEKVFSRRGSKMRKVLEQTLREHLPPESVDMAGEEHKEEYESAIQAVRENCAGLNRISFRKALEKMLAEVGMEVESEELAQVVTIRNQLVHQATYHPKCGSNEHQYRLLETFVSRFLMAVLKHPLPVPKAEEANR